MCVLYIVNLYYIIIGKYNAYTLEIERIAMNLIYKLFIIPTLLIGTFFMHGLDPIAPPPEDLAEFAQWFEDLPPEEQEEMTQAAVETLNTMSDEELAELFGPLVEEPAEASVPQPTEPPTVKPEEKPVVTPTPPKKPTKPTKETKDAIAIIDTIINSTEGFITKVHSGPELPEKINKWGKQRQLEGWKPTFSWKSVKNDIEQLNQKLHKLKDRDPKTKRYRYLDDLLKNEVLYNNLAQLRNTLAKDEPQFEVPSFAIQKMSVQSKQAVKKIINKYLEALYVLNIPSEIDKIIAEYEPTAKKLREEEEAAAKKALEEAKKPRVVTPTRVEGVPFGEEYYPNAPGYDYPYYSGAPTYGAPYRAAPVTTPTKRPPTPTEPAKPAASKDTKDKKPKPSKDKKPTITPRVDSAINQIDQLMTTISIDLNKAMDAIDKSVDAIDKSDVLKNIKEHLLGPQKVDTDTVKFYIPETIKAIKNAISNIKGLNFPFGKLGPAQKTKYKKELEDMFDSYKKTLDPIAKQIKEIQGEWSTLQNRISEAKKRAYGTPPPEQPEEAPEAQQPAPATPPQPAPQEDQQPTTRRPDDQTIFDLQKAIQELNDTIKDVGNKSKK